MFQEGTLRLKEALGPPRPSAKIATSRADGDVASKRGRPVSRVGTAQRQPSGAMWEGQDFQFSTRSYKSALTFLEFSVLGKSTNRPDLS